jgi:hypothetical protein
MKAYRGCRGMATLNLHGHYMEESGKLHASAPLLHMKERRYTLAGRGIGPRTSVDDSKKRNVSLFLPGFEFRITHPVVSLHRLH